MKFVQFLTKRTRLTLLVVLCIMSILVLSGSALASGESNNDTSTVYQKNSNGQKYGSALFAKSESDLDLIAAIGIDGTKGYVLEKDLNNEQEPKTPEEAIMQQEAKGDAKRQIPLYAVDGKTVIGIFEITSGNPKDLSE